ncbi:LacI family DNA-binding transcriptional regulator [Cellulomonas sp. KRMCY2]|uniref:LacI family DNA-binding transcriptional regulator n=1 Tax=Cellulomonas sp. KRMCY2 TaxID=1304865 RepID=UPI00045E853E|nr:LacI family DNA-binding transcriptional regulator [Cellulomonas sp. KRMCY2]
MVQGRSRARSARVTLKDVADRAGVSLSTASYVMNDVAGQSIPAPTRERVRRAADDLHYIPSAAARTLARGRSDTILVLLPDEPITFSLARFIDTFGEVVARAGYEVIFREHASGTSLAQVACALAPLAVTSPGPVAAADRAALKAAGVALVGAPEDGVLAVHDLQASIGYLQATHLLDRGHERIVYAGSNDPRLSVLQRGRCAGVERACRERSAAPASLEVIALDVDSATEAVARWVSAQPRLSGVCTFDDDHALAVLAGMRAHHLAAPADLAVIGVNNLASGRFSDPPLTSVDQSDDVNARELANAVISVVRASTGDSPGGYQPLATTSRAFLVQRSST